MSKKSKIDYEILSILEDYNLFLDSEKQVAMPFQVNEKDKNHVTSLMGGAVLIAQNPFGNTKLECEMREHSEYNYSFKILSDLIKTRMLFRMDEGSGAHWNRHLLVPVDQQQVTTPHFHKIGVDGIMYAYKTDQLEAMSCPLNIHDGFSVFCEECHILSDKVEINIHESGTLPLVFVPESDPLIGIQFP